MVRFALRFAGRHGQGTREVEILHPEADGLRVHILSSDTVRTVQRENLQVGSPQKRTQPVPVPANDTLTGEWGTRQRLPTFQTRVKKTSFPHDKENLRRILQSI